MYSPEVVDGVRLLTRALMELAQEAGEEYAVNRGGIPTDDEAADACCLWVAQFYRAWPTAECDFTTGLMIREWTNGLRNAVAAYGTPKVGASV